MNQLIPDAVNIVFAAKLDEVEKESRAIIMKEYAELRNAEAKCKRDKADAIIRNMADLQIALVKFENTYERIKKEYGVIQFAEDYIRKVKRQIKRYSDEKNKK